MTAAPFNVHKNFGLGLGLLSFGSSSMLGLPDCMVRRYRGKLGTKPHVAMVAGPAEKQAAAEKAAAAAAAASSSSAASSSEWMDDSFMPADEAGFFGSSASEGGPEAHPRAHSRQSRWFRQRHAENRHSSRPEANPEADEAQDLSASERASRAGGTVFDSRWDQNKSGNGAAGKQRRHDRDTGGTQFDSRWDNPQP